MKHHGDKSNVFCFCANTQLWNIKVMINLKRNTNFKSVQHLEEQVHIQAN